MSDLLRLDLGPVELRLLIDALVAQRALPVGEAAAGAPHGRRRRLVDLWVSLRGERQPADRGLW